MRWPEEFCHWGGIELGDGQTISFEIVSKSKILSTFIKETNTDIFELF